ncbi:hypothetical protein TIFTF001_008224 [Ficus carica]|uniref:Uncharacterized protein n=1 Tax=Ficus carica TaxID=3494 RepID=A0AA87ZKZ1_FICCA|nr:hypothetical protein TIFTF001_008224 [Ficus carica]
MTELVLSRIADKIIGELGSAAVKEIALNNLKTPFQLSKLCFLMLRRSRFTTTNSKTVSRGLEALSTRPTISTPRLCSGW